MSQDTTKTLVTKVTFQCPECGNDFYVQSKGQMEEKTFKRLEVGVKEALELCAFRKHNPEDESFPDGFFGTGS